MKKNVARILSCLLASIMLLTGCGGTATPATSAESGTEQPAKKDSLNFCIIGEPKTLDPSQSNELIAYAVDHQIYNYLIDYKTDGSMVPGLAESWDISEDGTEVAFRLRKDVKFHNGDTMTAEDVAFSLENAMASPFTQGVTSAFDSIRVADENTVVLKLKYSYGPIEYCIASSQIAIVNKKAYEADPAGYGRNPVGTGPYKFVEWKNGDKIVLEAFDGYYKGAANIKNLTFKIITDSSTAVVALEKGEVDIIDTPPKTDRQNLIDNPGIAYYETEIASTVFIAINNKDGRFANKELRQAISHAIDKESMILGAVEGIGTPIETPMAKSVFGWPEDFKNNEYNVEKAKALLAEAGYPEGLAITLKTTESPTYYKPTEVLQDQLKQIGITANIEKMERGAYFEDIMTNRNYEICVMAAVATYPDADYIYATYHSDMIENGRNYFNCNVPELDELLEKGRLSNDLEERKEIYKRICEIFKEECISIPLYTYMTPIAANKNLKGVMASPTNRMFVYDYSWE